MNTTLHTQPEPEFYIAGGTLDPSAASYIERTADTELLEAVKQGQFCYILTPRQMGKSSLMVRTAQSLQKSGTASVTIDLSANGAKDVTAEMWYLGQIVEIAEQLGLTGNYVRWWKRQIHLSVVQRFVKFFTHVLLKKNPDPVVIFIDEIDTTISLPFNSDDYFAAIRALYNQRASNPALKRLTFVLLGVASPSDLIQDATRTPFNIGIRIHLTDFTSEEARPLARGLAPNTDIAKEMLNQILFFTGGHPYFTQKTCMRVAKWARSQWSVTEATVIVDKVVDELFLSDSGKNTDDNLKFVSKRILCSEYVEELLKYYKRICEREVLLDNEVDPLPVALKLSGLVKTDNGGVLAIRNFIYQRVFDKKWIKQALLEQEPIGAQFLNPWGTSIKRPQFLYDVFISYSHRDSKWVRGYLLPQLKGAGLRVWSDSEVIAGEPWSSKVENAMEQSCNMLIILSPDSVTSQWVLRESQAFLSYLLAWKQERRLIPILLRHSEAPSYLKSYRWVDFTQEQRWDASMEQLLLALKAPRRAQPGITSSFRGNMPSTRYNTAAIRTLLSSAFEDDELTGFAYDYFPSFYKQRFTLDTTKMQKIQQIIEYVDEHHQFDQLLDAIAIQKPHHYDKFRDQLEIREE